MAHGKKSGGLGFETYHADRPGEPDNKSIRAHGLHAVTDQSALIIIEATMTFMEPAEYVLSIVVL